MAGAPQGNKNAGKSKPWADAIRRAIARHDAKEKDEGAKFLNKLADQLLIDCLNGEKSAMDELTNRLDGKPAQAIVGDDDFDPVRMFQRIENVIVDPKNPDA